MSQLHFVQAYLRHLHADGVRYDGTARTELAAAARAARLPTAHLAIPDTALIEAQFAFWWELVCDVAAAVSARDHRLLPDDAVLRRRISDVGGRPEMSSFRDEEMDELIAVLATYRSTAADELTPHDVTAHRFVPQLLRVELGFQGSGPRYPRRPRPEGSDPHESLLRSHCRHAQARAGAGTADIVDRIYLEVSRTLDAAGNEVYQRLIDAYNANHPGAEVTSLHIGADAHADPNLHTGSALSPVVSAG
ncbi:hypothetical protein AB0E69_40665 [Kribbella sp. NPDC026611]|uniref:hypothetical protein n=1 Tax=Kribbella sp. NPDC026611 TaxID=3154911 RepID=UPI0033CA76FC